MDRFFASSMAIWLLAGCASIKAPFEDALEYVGVDRQEQHKLVYEGKEVALAPGRHGTAGMYINSGANPQFNGAGGEIGGIYNDYWWEAKAGIALYYAAARHNLFVGPTAAVHVQLPTRITPFAGFGVFAGYASLDVLSFVLENDPGQFPQYSERTTQIDGPFASVYPEVGVHFWLADKIRLTTSATYQFTTEGHRHDFWTIGAGVAILFPSSW